MEADLVPSALAAVQQTSDRAPLRTAGPRGPEIMEKELDRQPLRSGTTAQQHCPAAAAPSGRSRVRERLRQNAGEVAGA
jgi:hypothetical protein